MNSKSGTSQAGLPSLNTKQIKSIKFRAEKTSSSEFTTEFCDCAEGSVCAVQIVCLQSKPALTFPRTAVQTWLQLLWKWLVQESH